MQENAHNSSTGPVGYSPIAKELAADVDGCPTAEELAAYVDGGLPEAEARRVTDHLASCEECYEVYSDTVRFVLATEPAPVEQNVVHFRRKASQAPVFPVWQQIAAAAVVVLGIGGIAGALFLFPPSPLVTADLTASLPNRPEVAGQAWLGPTYRGEGGGAEVNLDESSLRMGVQLINLQMSLRAREVEASQDIVARILGLLSNQPLVSDLEEQYKKITLDLENGTPPRDLLPEAERLAGEVRDAFEPSSLDFGQWVEGGRLAAIANDPSFLRQGKAQSFLRRTLWRQKLGLGDFKVDPAAIESLQAISDVLDKENLGASDYASLRQSFDRILQIYYPES